MISWRCMLAFLLLDFFSLASSNSWKQALYARKRSTVDGRYIAKDGFEAQHNDIRLPLGLPPVKNNFNLADRAKACAAQLANGNLEIAGHPCTNLQSDSENLYRRSTASAVSGATLGEIGLKLLAGAMKAWYAEVMAYDGDRPLFPFCSDMSCMESWSASFNAGSDIPKVGHFLLLTWKSITHVGCAWSQNRDYYYVVCRYTPYADLTNAVARTQNIPVGCFNWKNECELTPPFLTAAYCVPPQGKACGLFCQHKGYNICNAKREIEEYAMPGRYDARYNARIGSHARYDEYNKGLDSEKELEDLLDY